MKKLLGALIPRLSNTGTTALNVRRIQISVGSVAKMSAASWFRTALYALVLAVLPNTGHAGEMTRVSVDSAGQQANAPSWLPRLSADGRYVAFYSVASNLVTGDTNGTYDVFVHDRLTGETTRVSVDSAGQQATGSSGASDISADGRYVAFISIASNLVVGDTNGAQDIFVHDRLTGETTRVSVDSSGQQATSHSYDPSISADGRYVAFRSPASNLVVGDTNGTYDIFVHDRQTGETTRVSVDSSGQQTTNDSNDPSISADSRYVSFSSLASNLVEGDTNSLEEIFMHDRLTGETIRVSVDSNGQPSEKAHSYDPSISADGRYVAFESYANDLVAGDTNNIDIFVHDRLTGETTRVSVDSSGQQATSHSYDPSISADGRYVAFRSPASNLVVGDTNGTYDIFVHDRQTRETTRVSVDSNGQEGNGATNDHPSISADGRYVAFASSASNLVAGDTNGTYDIFVHDRGAPTESSALHHFTFAPIPAEIAPNTPITVQITARDSNGNIYPYTGTVILTSLLGYPSPKQVTLSNGSGSGMVQLDAPGTGNALTASGGGVTGQSNTFTVTGATGSAKLQIHVVNQVGSSLAGSTVFLDLDGDGSPDRQETADTWGRIAVEDLSPGNVTIWAQEPGGRLQSPRVTEPIEGSTTRYEILVINQHVGQRTPVLLVPGIMGSHEKALGKLYPPRLGDYPVPGHRLELYDPLPLLWTDVGWTELEKNLAPDPEADCIRVEKAPFDWRMPVQDVVKKYLIPAIKALKDETGSSKVNIVAHSTGGLVARAYIQSADYANDVNKLAMVGTPNMGAVNAYYLWEGGDPKWAGNLNDGSDFYWDTTEAMYEDTYDFGELYEWDRGAKIQVLYHEHVKEMQDLLPTFDDFLIFDTGAKGIVTESNKNTMLDTLNNDVDGKLKMSATGADGTVRTKVFYGFSKATIRSHEAYWLWDQVRYDTGMLYEDGIPQPDVDPVKTDGDGTVLEMSATMPCDEGWADCESVSDAGHSVIVKKAIPQLLTFLAEGEPTCIPTSSVATSSSLADPSKGKAAKARGKKRTDTTVVTASVAAPAEAPTAVLGLTIIGRAQPYLVTPSGVGHGVNPDTQDLETPDSSVDISLGAKGSSLSLLSPTAGTYTLKLSSAHHEESTVVITFASGTQQSKLRLRAFVHGAAATFQFSLDPTATQPISLPVALSPPVNLHPAPYGSPDAVTVLAWDRGANNPASFNVYGRRVDEPKLKFLCSSPINQFLTANPWDDSTDKLPYVYAVAGVNADGSESFLSDLAENNDRDRDGVTDEDELAKGLDPANPDSDYDGLSDGQEVGLMTNPLAADSDGDGYSDSVEVRGGGDPTDATSTPNLVPTAHAGEDQNVAPSTLVTLDGSMSFDPDSSPAPLTYAWRQFGGPTVSLTNPDTATPSFTPLEAGFYAFELKVNDGANDSEWDSVRVLVGQ